MGAYAYQTTRDLKRRYDQYIDAQYRFTATIDSDYEDDMYNYLLQWIYDNVPQNEINAYSLVSTWRNGKNYILKSSRDQFGQKVLIEGHEAYISIRSINGNDNDSGAPNNHSREIVVSCRNRVDLEFVTKYFVDYLEKQINGEINEEAESGAIRKKYYNYSAAGWSWSTFISRNHESVILKDGEQEAIMEDLDNFIALKPEYLRVNIPWHRGYLLYGPPGTGKTSLALSLASGLGLPIFFLSLSDVASDSALTAAITFMKKEVGVSEAVLILEDIDTVMATTSRGSSMDDYYKADVASTSDSSDLDMETGLNMAYAMNAATVAGTKSGTGLTLGGLLNVLDGVGTPSGLITIMTTNHRELLDAALIRPGRVDFELHVDYLDQPQLERLVQWYVKDTKPSDIPILKDGVRITPAEITGVVKMHLGDRDTCVREIYDYVQKVNESV